MTILTLPADSKVRIHIEKRLAVVEAAERKADHFISHIATQPAAKQAAILNTMREMVEGSLPKLIGLSHEILYKLNDRIRTFGTEGAHPLSEKQVAVIVSDLLS